MLGHLVRIATTTLIIQKFVHAIIMNEEITTPDLCWQSLYYCDHESGTGANSITLIHVQLAHCGMAKTVTMKVPVVMTPSYLGSVISQIRPHTR